MATYLDGHKKDWNLYVSEVHVLYVRASESPLRVKPCTLN